MYEVFELLLKKYGITAYRFCKDTGVNSSTISTWKKKKSLVSTEIGKIICGYFGITMDYLLTGICNISQESSGVVLKDELKAGYSLDSIMDELEKNLDGPLHYKGKLIDDEFLDVLEKGLELRLARARRNKSND